MSASFLLAGFGLSGCRRPEEKILPFGKAPENYIHGAPQFFATAMPTRGSAIPLVVKSNDGRPTKIEGNALHPDSNGASDHYAQASILNVYDPDRAMRFVRNGNIVKREAALDFLGELSKKSQADGGQGLCFLLERSSSPSRARLRKLIGDKFPKARWFVYEPVDFDVHRLAAAVAFGKSVKPYFKFDEVKVIVSLDCDFIGGEEDAYLHIRRFTKGRKIEKPTDTVNRLYAVEALFTLTGANADHRLRLPSSAVEQAVKLLGTKIGWQFASEVGPRQLDDEKASQWISKCAEDLLTNPGRSLVVRVQPLIEPLFGGISELEVLARIGGLEKVKPYDIVRETYGGLAGGGEDNWKRFLPDGFLPGSAAKPVEVQFNASAAAAVIGAAKPVGASTRDALEVLFHHDYKVDDGRYNNNGWLHEF